jgi:hypothetical protein
MLKPIIENKNRQISLSRPPKKISKQENQPQKGSKPSKSKDTIRDRKPIFQSTSKNLNNEHSFKYQLLSAENNIIVLKKIKSIPVFYNLIRRSSKLTMRIHF